MKNRKPKPRNPFHNHPLMHKGGSHTKSHKADRAKAKRALRRIGFSPSKLISNLLGKKPMLFKYLPSDIPPAGLDPLI